MFKGYVINLTRSKERLYRFNQHPDAKFFTRLEAIDKNDFEHISNVENLLFDQTFVQSHYHRASVSLGEICCTLSHIKAWKMIAEDQSLNDDDFAVVAEDDIILAPRFAYSVRQLIDNMRKSESNIVLLHKIGGRIPFWKSAISTGYEEIKPVVFLNHNEYDNDGASLYLIRRSFAKKMTEKCQGIKPFWLADIFTAFCESNHITVANPLLGSITEWSDSYIWDRDLPNKKKKILFVHQSLIIGGAETILLNYLKILALNPNYEVELLLLNEAPISRINSLIPDSVKVSFILTEVESEFNIFLYWKLQDQLTEKERHYFSSWQNGIKIRTNNAILDFLTQNHFDIIVNFNQHLDDFLSQYDVLSKIIRWVHIKDDLDRYRENATQYYPILAKHCAAITISHDMDHLAKISFAKMNLALPTQMIYNPVDNSRICRLAEEINPEDKALFAQPFILSVARLFEYKNHLQMLDIYAELKKRGCKEKLYIIGKGHEHIEAQLVDKIHHLGLQDDCLLLGSRDNPFPFMKHAKLFMHTSRLEGLPTVFIESMICGTPIIAFDCPTGPREILNDGKFGMLIPLGDEKAFIEQAYQFLTNDIISTAYRKKLIEAVKPFMFESVSKQFFAFLKTIE